MALNYQKLQKNSTTRILYLLNLLYKNAYSRSQIVEEFKKTGISINKTSALKYIKKLQDFGFKIQKESVKNKNFYSLKGVWELNFSLDEINSSQNVKKEIILKKPENEIRRVMSLFYKFALEVSDDELKYSLIDFEHYSKINWHLVNKLKTHCKNHDVIKIIYMLNKDEIKEITLHADTVETHGNSNRLYLYGIFKGSKKLSKLPVDKIFMVKKVVEKFVRYDFEGEVLTYKIPKKTFEKIELDKEETAFEEDSETITIKRPLDDSFQIVQRLLSFCPDLYYVSDENIKNLLKKKLLEMKEIYEN